MYYNISTVYILPMNDIRTNNIVKTYGARALVVKCFPRTQWKLIGSNHSGVTNHEFSGGPLV